MAKVLAVMGESGSGKTTAMRNLPPEQTYYIDADGKGLSWKGWRTQYNAEKKNYYRTSDKATIDTLMRTISAGKSDKGVDLSYIKYIIVDTINAIMVDDMFARMNDKNYDKWSELAEAVYSLITNASKLRDDLTVIFLAHSETVRDESGFVFTRIKTSGKMLTKIVLESKLTTVILCKAVAGKYLFEVHSRNSTAKTPMGAFEVDEIENDIIKVLDALKDY